MNFCDVYKGDRIIAKRVKYCGTFSRKLVGLMFTPTPGAGAFLPDVKDIHMNFVRFELKIVWLDGDFKVLHKVRAKRWKMYYGPARARHVLELPVYNDSKINIGDRLTIKTYERR